jgi:hypothetical protein
MPELEKNHDSLQPASQRRVPRILYGGYFLAFALLFCFCATVMTRGQIRRSRVEALLRFKASVEAQYGEYEHQPPPTMSASPNRISIEMGRGQRVIGFVVMDDPPRSIAWIPAIFGDYCLTHVTDIAICDERFSDADVELLLPFADLRALDLSDAAITDEGLAKLAPLHRLELLRLSGAQVTNASLRMLANFSQLKELELPECADDETVAILQHELPNCSIRR